MKVLLQRVSHAKVIIDERINGEIDNGFLLYVCFEEGDTNSNVEAAITKVINLRIFEDDKNKMNFNLSQVNGQILSISQFTLSWDGSKGHRPSFDKSLSPNKAKILYKYFNDGLINSGLKIEKGIFGADMKVHSINDGPVTFMFNF